MNTFPEMVQILFMFIVVGCIPTAMLVYVGKFLPSALRFPWLVIGIVLTRMLYRSVPVQDDVKNIAGIMFFVFAIAFGLWLVKKGWYFEKD